MSLPEHIQRLKRDLLVSPPRISAYRELPFAILLYPANEERQLRLNLRRFAAAIEHESDKRVAFVSLADLLWEALEESHGIEEFVEQERFQGFAKTEETIARTLNDPDFVALPDRLARRLTGLDPARDIAVLVRAGALAPALYHMSTLLDEMQGRTMVPTVLCYPGALEGATGLKFMSPFVDKEPMGNYRVEIYRAS